MSNLSTLKTISTNEFELFLVNTLKTISATSDSFPLIMSHVQNPKLVSVTSNKRIPPLAFGSLLSCTYICMVQLLTLTTYSDTSSMSTPWMELNTVVLLQGHCSNCIAGHCRLISMQNFILILCNDEVT